jgi:hypothetical protein
VEIGRKGRKPEMGHGGVLGGMLSLGIGAEKPSGGEVHVGFRQGAVRHAKVALTSAGSAAIVFALFSLLQHRPAEGFGLLAAWGPWPIIALVALGIGGQFLNRINDTIQSAFGAVVTSVQQGAEAQGKTADALTRLADQGSRNAQEVERMSLYAAQEFPVLWERMDRVDSMLRDIHEKLSGSKPGQ